MIKLEKVEKYFNLGKSNEIHVINNTSMTLPDKGIVCFIGPSGCGKTTLLNAISGLDKVDSGKIDLDGDVIAPQKVNIIDDIRNKSIGYVFQNFYLLDNKTVFENVAIALRMIGINDEEVVAERVNYCLKSLGIYQYRKKYAKSLSGGQRQRVAIARAIVKNPKVIIADEPTGNLDSANTIEIMNIIKSISKEKLVILVTHEQSIAEFYSDYIAIISDGKIVDSFTNDGTKYLDAQIDSKIYLKDLPVHNENRKTKVNFYSDGKTVSGIKIVLKGNNIFVEAPENYNVLDASQNVELIDDHLKQLDESMFEETAFEYDAYLPDGYEAVYTSQYSFKGMIKRGWETVKSFKTIKKLLLAGFLFASMFTFLAVSNLFGVVDVQPKDYRTTSKYYMTVSNSFEGDDLLKLIKSLDYVKYVLPGDTKKSVNMAIDDYLQTKGAETRLNVSIANTSLINGEDIIYGRLTKSDHEVVLDKQVVDKFISNGDGRAAGITKPSQLLGRKISIPNLEDYKIVGISNTESPSLYVDSSQDMYILANADDQSLDKLLQLNLGGDVTQFEKNVIDFDLAPKTVKISEGSKPKKLNEVVVNEDNAAAYPIGEKIDVKMADKKLKVVGYYHDGAANNMMYVSADTIYQDYVYNNPTFTVCSKKTEAVCELLKSEDIECTVNDEVDKLTYIAQMKGTLVSSLIVAGIILLVSLIEMYLMLRSSFLARIGEVGILRAIGLKKKDINKLFTGEILVISLITAIPGIIIMYLLLDNVVQITDYISGNYMVNPLIALISLVLVVAFNLLAGLIPVSRTLRKTPAEILARIDI